MSKARANGEGSIYPYRNGFAAYVWVTTPSGKRTRKYVYGKTREAVHEKWIKLHQEAKAGPVATSIPTVGQYVGSWLSEVIGPNRAPATVENYNMFARLYIVPGLGSTRLDRLRTRDVQTWLNTLAKTCQCCAQGKDTRRPEKRRRCCAVGACCGAYLSARTLSDVRACLRSALSRAVNADELIARNPAKAVTLPPVRTHRNRAWSTDEARRFLESANADGDPLYAAYVLVLILGLRRGEVLGLAWDEVDYDGDEVTIGFQLQRVGGRLLRREVKTEASEAPLPLPAICANALRGRAKRQAVDREAAGPVWRDTANPVFTTRYGTPIEPRNFVRSFRARCSSAGVRLIKVHDARRTCATLLADLDVHPRVMMRILRHAQVEVTMKVYTEASSKATRDALKRLGDSLGEAAG